MENQGIPDDEPHVQIFGRDIDRDRNYNDDRRYRRRHHHGGLVFGLLLVFAGAILLANNLGIVPWTVWNYIWPMWPLILVLIGLRIVFGRLWGGNIIVFIVALAIVALVLINALDQIGMPLIQSGPGPVM